MSTNTKYNLLSAELLSQVLDTNASGIIIIDKNNSIIFWNHWLENTSLIKKDDALNNDLFSIFSELESSRIHKACELSIKKGNASFISHAFNKKPFPLFSNGDKDKPIHQLIYIKPIRLKNNKRYCFIQINDSSTAVYREKQLRKMAHDAKSLSNLKSGFVSSVSHELRTPLTSIMGALGILKSGIENPGSGDFKLMLEIAYNNADRLLLLINDILDIEKIESGKMKFNFAAIDINEVIELCIKQNKGLADKYQVNFNYTNSTLPKVTADKDRIIQVLNNLISNAAKFEPDGGTIEITSAANDDKVCVTITDHGIGIPNEFKGKIFEAFTQADISNTKNIAGTGLGLAISKTIVERHKGKINFESKQGEGTRFYFTLPVDIE